MPDWCREAECVTGPLPIERPDWCEAGCESGPAPWTPEQSVPVVPTEPPLELANTGVDVGWSPVGVLLLIAGVVLLFRRHARI